MVIECELNRNTVSAWTQLIIHFDRGYFSFSRGTKNGATP